MPNLQAEPSSPTRWQFSLRRLLGITTVYAVLAASFADMPIRLLLISAAIVTIFVLFDVTVFGRTETKVPPWCRILMSLAFYSACFSLCNFIGLLVHIYLPEARPSKSFWQGIVELFDGTFLREFGRALGIVLGLWLGTAIFSLAGTLFSFCCCRHTWSAWILAAINIGLLGNFFVFWILDAK